MQADEKKVICLQDQIGNTSFVQYKDYSGLAGKTVFEHAIVVWTGSTKKQRCEKLGETSHPRVAACLHTGCKMSRESILPSHGLVQGVA